MIGEHWILGSDHIPVDVPLEEWARWFEKTDRRVARTDVGEAYVSTVFLGIDHSFGSGPPLLFESMVFGGILDEDQDRYSTWEEAVAGHEAMVRRVRAACAGGTDD